MNTHTIKNRNDIPSDAKWDIEKMYTDAEAVQADLRKSIELANKLTELKGSITASSDNLIKAIRLYLDASRCIEKAYTYSHMKHDEDNSVSKYTELYGQCMSTLANYSALVSFFTPEFLEASEETIRGYIAENDDLKEYEFMLSELLEQKDHTLSKEEENILASLGEVLGAPDEIFSALNDVDMVYGEVLNDDGQKVSLSHGNFINMLKSESREVRENTFNTFFEEYKKHNNTIATAYNYNVKKTAVTAKLRKYSSSLEAALKPNNIPLEVYDNLIQAVHDALPAMHKYYAIRKRVMGLDDMKMYDIHKPLVKPEGMKFTFEEAVSICIKALEPMGEDYIRILENGLLHERWVDIYENKAKTSGAYSFGSYDSFPYILMNFHGELSDVFTLIHESGHSMHSYYTRHKQPYQYGGHSIFTAEVASTVNETLLIKYLLENCESDEMKIYLINFYIDEFKSTLFRQTMFAEFEKYAHEVVEAGGSLTAEMLNKKYDALNTMYFGDAVDHDDMIQYEWSRIPHFYRDYYVYQYATGYSAANAIANRILSMGDSAVADYKSFLESGDSDYPIELLKLAGVDMSTKEPVASALSTFAELIDELDELMK